MNELIQQVINEFDRLKVPAKDHPIGTLQRTIRMLSIGDEFLVTLVVGDEDDLFKDRVQIKSYDGVRILTENDLPIIRAIPTPEDRKITTKNQKGFWDIF